MRYGHFDNENREYVIDRVDIPVSWTNYIGTKDMYGVFNHTAGGYLLYKTPEYHRITRFRANAVPMDRPGHYVYLRDDDTGEYWSVSWQPVGKPLDKAKYSCRHGLSYSVYECEYNGIAATQKLFVAEDDPVEYWDISIKNVSGRKRRISLFTYCEFSFHHVMIDNQNFQMSLYCAGSRYKDGVIEHDLYYEPDGYQYFTSSFEPDGFDCLRDSFIGSYRTETNPIVVENGSCLGSFDTTGNHCAVLQKKYLLEDGEEERAICILGEGNIEAGKEMRRKYANAKECDEQFAKLRSFWDERLSSLQIETPDEGMNTLINIWTIYQSVINVRFSRFSSFIEVGGRTGLGYRDTAQDAMTVPGADAKACRTRILQLMQALTSKGYGLHLFDSRWFDKTSKQEDYTSPTVIPTMNKESYVHGLKDACSDDALWLVGALTSYIKETGDKALLDIRMEYCDEGESDIYGHLKAILDLSEREVGATGICKGLRADWNDCLNLGGGESAMVSFLHYWALKQFVELAEYLGRRKDAEHYAAVTERVRNVCEKELWDGEWYIRGITKNGKRIGTKTDTEGKVHLESNAWAVLSGVATGERAQKCLDAIDKYLYTEYGLILNAPPFKTQDPDIGFVTRVYPGIKENGAVFSHPNPWAWAAESLVGNGNRAKRYYDALSPYNQNDKIEIREAEPYSYCQFIYGSAHRAYGRARHPFMTGSAGWAYYSATQFMLGIAPKYDELSVNPCIPSDWEQFKVTKRWRGAVYHITVLNPDKVQKGVRSLEVNGKPAKKIGVFGEGETVEVKVIMG